MKRLLITSLIILLSYAACAQEEWKDNSVDKLFAQARVDATEKKYDKAREKFNYILQQTPEYHEVRVQLGRTYAWEGRYKEAMLIYDSVLKQEPDDINALMAKIDVQVWSNSLADALNTVEKASQYHSDHEEFLLKKAEILNHQGKDAQAIETLDYLLKINPANLEAFDMKIVLEEQSRSYTATLRSGLDFFNQAFDPAIFGTMEVNKENEWGAVIGRVNYANRFDEASVQGEVDVYPMITENIYGYVNYGYSQSVLFSNHRLGAEVFAVILNKVEASVGARYLTFSTKNIITYTGSARYYFKSIEFSVRPFYTYEKSFSAASVDFGIKKNFTQPEDFIEISTGFGYSPDIRINQTFAAQTEEVYTLESKRASLKVQKGFGDRWSVAMESRINQRKLSAESDDYLLITTLISSVKFKF